MKKRRLREVYFGYLARIERDMQIAHEGAAMLTEPRCRLI
jgi:hypothetical protein